MKHSPAYLIAVLGLGALTASGAAAQQHDGANRGAQASSMASLMNYTAEERAVGLREGRGMGLAMPAEANGYPGPRHVLEVADSIALTPIQRARTQSLFDVMKEDASRLGEQLLLEEAALDDLFVQRKATPAALDTAVRAIGRTESELKLTHLRTHLEMMQLLTPAQVAQYVGLRRSGAGSGRTRPHAPAEDHSTHR